MRTSSTQHARTQRWGRRAAFVALVAAGASIIALLLMELLKDRWGGLDCSDASTHVLEWLQMASILSALVAGVAGLLGLVAAGARSKVYALAGIATAVGVVGLAWVIPMNTAEGPLGDVGQITCGIMVTSAAVAR